MFQEHVYHCVTSSEKHLVSIWGKKEQKLFKSLKWKSVLFTLLYHCSRVKSLSSFLFFISVTTGRPVWYSFTFYCKARLLGGVQNAFLHLSISAFEFWTLLYLEYFCLVLTQTNPLLSPPFCLSWFSTPPLSVLFK